MEKSTYYNFNLPNSANDEVADINDISDNFRTIDTELHGTQLFFANVNATTDVELDLIDADDNTSGQIVIQRDGIIYTNVKTPTQPDYAANKAYVDTKQDAITSSTTLTLDVLTANVVKGLANLTSSSSADMAVNKKYVDDIIGDINTVLANLVEVTA